MYGKRRKSSSSMRRNKSRPNMGCRPKGIDFLHHKCGLVRSWRFLGETKTNHTFLLYGFGYSAIWKNLESHIYHRRFWWDRARILDTSSNF